MARTKVFAHRALTLLALLVAGTGTLFVAHEAASAAVAVGVMMLPR